MKHILVVYGKPKHGRNMPEYIGPVPQMASQNVMRWFIEKYKGLPPFSQAMNAQYKKG